MNSIHKSRSSTTTSTATKVTNQSTRSNAKVLAFVRQHELHISCPLDAVCRHSTRIGSSAGALYGTRFFLLRKGSRMELNMSLRTARWISLGR